MGYQQKRHPGRKWTWDFLRYMRTTQERRHWDAEYGRASRSPCRLPDSWDDYWRHPVRTWKRHRATQYKPLAIDE